jgi:PAS domain S-box-containing protein
MPKGHLPVTSYLAVPVMSRTGEVLGGLFFGHEQTGVFTTSDEDTVVEIAARAATAIDNTRLLDTAQRFASIVESSDDAIVSKDLTGTIRSWNKAAERIFGYTAKEIVGRPITTLIPEHLQHEEPEIIRRISAGERVDHYETVRQKKDGTLFHVSVTVSPIRDRTGKVIGASKIARDIDAAKKAQETQALLLREMNHRVKNLFAVASGVVALSARSAESAPDLARSIQARLAALARAHDLTVALEGAATAAKAHLSELLKTILSPYDAKEGRIFLDGPDVECGSGASTSLALLLHEFATNAVKYGALSVPVGQVDVRWTLSATLRLTWRELGGPPIGNAVDRHGFGTTLTGLTVRSMGGTIERAWNAEGLEIRLSVPLSHLAG